MQIKPIIFKIPAFDAAKEQIIYYTYNGSQQFSVKLKIFNNKTGQTVYENTQTTFQLQFVLPPNSIPNGKDYNAEIIVYDKDNKPSTTSDKALFTCFLTPNFRIENIENNQLIPYSNYNLDISYSQITGELLNFYTVHLMDFGGNIIQTSQSLFPATDDMTYLLKGLLDNTSYQIQVIGETVNGMVIQTKPISFTVEYICPAVYSVVSLENIKREASVKVKVNIIGIDGTSFPTPPIYINNKEVDIRNPQHWVKFDKGFNIEKDFAIRIECRAMKRNSVFFELSSSKQFGKITLEKWQGEFFGIEQNYIILSAKNKHFGYRAVSQPLPLLSDNELVYIDIIKSKNLYSISCKRKV